MILFLFFSWRGGGGLRVWGSRGLNRWRWERVCVSSGVGGFEPYINKYLFLVVGGVGDTWIYLNFCIF